MARMATMPRLGGTLPSEHEDDNSATEVEEQSTSAHEHPFNPLTSERRYWRDPLNGEQREIWRPGDGNGDVEHDHFERAGPIAPLGQRWRLYQSPGPFKARIHEPPSNVILDDRAVYEVLQSNIPRAQLSRRWSHDFSGTANVRHRRTHRGRAAFKDEHAASDKDKYHSFKPAGKATPLYFFSGEKDFEPVFYSDAPADIPTENPPADSEDDNTPPKRKQHNQYTAPELLVRNGAKSQSKTKGKYRPRVNTFLRRDASPPLIINRRSILGGVGVGRTGAQTSGNPGQSSNLDFSFAPAMFTGLTADVESMWVERDEENELAVIEVEEEVQPSVFDMTDGRAAAPTRDKDHIQTHAPSVTPLRRQASSNLLSARSKVPKKLGYIERLAAGLPDEDNEEPAASAQDTTIDPIGTTAGDRVAELEDKLNAANIALADRNRQIMELQMEVDDLQTQMAMQRSVDDDQV